MRNVNLELLMLQMVEGMSSLMKNPDLSTRIKEAYELNEAEKKALEESKKIIMDGSALKESLEKEAKKYSDIGERIAKAEALEKELSKKAIELTTKEKQVLRKFEEAEEKFRSLKSYEEHLSEREEDILKRQNKIKEDEKEILKQRGEIKAVLDRSRSILGEL